MMMNCTGCSDDSVKETPKPTPGGTTTTTSVVPELDKVIMYEANPRLYGTNNDCLKGLEARLDNIKDLGVNVLWIMPICEYGKDSKSFGSPYCIKDYTKVEPKLGTLEDLKSLVKSAHEKGMAVILDWVANHTSWDNAWINNKSWYTTNASGAIVSPSGDGWVWNDVADLNYSNEDMRSAMIEAMKYWVKNADVDGYRCDAADFVPAEFWAKAIQELRASCPDKTLLMLAEGTNKSNFTSGFDMNYAWAYNDALVDVFKNKQSATKLNETHEQEYAVVPKGNVKLRYSTNHDKSAYDGTPIEVYGGKQGSLSALAIAAWMGGVPLIYSSQECAQSAALNFVSYYNYNWDADKEYTEAVKQILLLRKNTEIFATGRQQDYSTTNAVMFYLLDYPSEALVVANVRGSQQTVTLPSAVVGKEFKNAVTGETKTLTEELTLGAYEYALWVK